MASHSYSVGSPKIVFGHCWKFRHLRQGREPSSFLGVVIPIPCRGATIELRGMNSAGDGIQDIVSGDQGTRITVAVATGTITAHVAVLPPHEFLIRRIGLTATVLDLRVFRVPLNDVDLGIGVIPRALGSKETVGMTMLERAAHRVVTVLVQL